MSVDYFAPALAFDPESETLYAPEGDFGEQGIYVFDTSTNPSTLSGHLRHRDCVENLLSDQG